MQLGQLFRSASFDLPALLGPADGYYLVREGGEEVAVVVYLSEKGSNSTTQRAICIPTDQLREEEALEWIQNCQPDRAFIDRCMQLLNLSLRTQRAATADPYLRELNLNQMLKVELGYGSGEELIKGQLRASFTVTAENSRQAAKSRLNPQDKVAATLAGHKPPFLAEEFLLRAKLDLDLGHDRSAALQAKLALEVLLKEIEQRPELKDRQQSAKAEQDLKWLQKSSAESKAAAETALSAELKTEQLEHLWQLIGTMERLLRRHHYGS